MRAKLAARGVWVRVARASGYPVSSPRLPRPPLARGRTPFRLSRVLLACDLNPRYLESWPLAARGWEEVAGIEPMLVLVAGEQDAPAELLRDPRVRRFEPIDGIHTAFQAQCIRLLYPSLLDATGAVLISDMELVPARPEYFHDTVARIDERFFVAYRGEVLYDRGEISIPYNAARSETWAELFGVRGIDDVTDRLVEWAADVEYDGVRGGTGWYTDQHVLFRALGSWPKARERLWLMDDQYTGYHRLEREVLEEARTLTPELRRGIESGRYTDVNSCIPHSQFAELNEAVLAAVIAAERRRLRRGRTARD